MTDRENTMAENTPLEYRCPQCKTWGPEIRVDFGTESVQCVECGTALPRNPTDSLPTRPAQLADRIAAYTDHVSSDGDGIPPWEQLDLDDGEWHEIGFSWTRTEAELYVDSVCIAKDDDFEGDRQ